MLMNQFALTAGDPVTVLSSGGHIRETTHDRPEINNSETFRARARTTAARPQVGMSTLKVRRPGASARTGRAPLRPPPGPLFHAMRHCAPAGSSCIPDELFSRLFETRRYRAALCRVVRDKWGEGMGRRDEVVLQRLRAVTDELPLSVDCLELVADEHKSTGSRISFPHGK